VSFAAITLCVASQQAIPNVSMYFFIESVRRYTLVFGDYVVTVTRFTHTKLALKLRTKLGLCPEADSMGGIHTIPSARFSGLKYSRTWHNKGTSSITILYFLRCYIDRYFRSYSPINGNVPKSVDVFECCKLL